MHRWPIGLVGSQFAPITPITCLARMLSSLHSSSLTPLIVTFAHHLDCLLYLTCCLTSFTSLNLTHFALLVRILCSLTSFAYMHPLTACKFCLLASFARLYPLLAYILCSHTSLARLHPLLTRIFCLLASFASLHQLLTPLLKVYTFQFLAR